MKDDDFEVMLNHVFLDMEDFEFMITTEESHGFEIKNHAAS